MLTYTALLIASLVVSAVVFFLYRVISDSSRSVYSSKEHLILYEDAPKSRREPLNVNDAAYRPKAYGPGGHSTPRNFAATHPAMPTDSVDWGWQGSGVQLKEPRLQSGHFAGHSNHCSLFDVQATEPKPVVRQNPHTGKLHREEMHKAAGRTYKVTRKTSSENADSADLSKPWGW